MHPAGAEHKFCFSVYHISVVYDILYTVLKKQKMQHYEAGEENCGIGLLRQGVRNCFKIVSQLCAQAFYLIPSVIKYHRTRYNLFGKVTESRAPGQRPAFCITGKQEME